MSLIPSNIDGPCPVCGRTKDGDCRKTEDSQLVLCHTRIEGTRGDESGGYTWIGKTDEGAGWGKWIVPSAEPRKNPGFRPVGQKFEFPYKNQLGQIVCTKFRIYQKQSDGSVKKKDWWEPKGVKGDDILPYRYREAIDLALTCPELPILIDESELTVDLLMDLGIPAVAFGRKLSTSRIQSLFAGHESRVVVCVDRDAPGVEKAARYQRVFPMAGTLRPYPESDFWLPAFLPESGGLDVRDWTLEERLTREHVLDAITYPERPEPGSPPDSQKSHFATTPEGGLVYKTAQWDTSGKTAVFKGFSDELIGNHLLAVAYTEGVDGDTSSLHLQFKTVRGQIRSLSIPRSLLCSTHSNSALEKLVDHGYTYVWEMEKNFGSTCTNRGLAKFP